MLVCKFCINLAHVAMPNRSSKKTIGEQKHTREVDKCRISLPGNFLLTQSHNCQCPVQDNPCQERGGQLKGHPLPHRLGICHLVWQLINTYMNMYIAGISTCFAMGAFVSSITSTSVLVHLIYTCGAIHTRITCTFVSIWEIRFEHVLFKSDIECCYATEMQFANR